MISGELTFRIVIQTLYSWTRIHLVDDHLLPLITGQPPESKGTRASLIQHATVAGLENITLGKSPCIPAFRF